MKPQRICSVITMSFLLALASSAQQSSRPDQRLHGTWLVKVYPHGMTAPLLGTDLNQFGCDGTEIAPTSMGAVGLPPGVTGDSTGTGTGTYAATADGSFAFTFYRLVTNAGVLSGYQRISGTIAVSPSGNESFDSAQTDFYDLNWHVLFTAQTDAYGTRLQTPTNAADSHCP